MDEHAGHTDLRQHAVFAEHTIESAPPAARRFMTATANSLGYLPSATARWAASPQLLDGFGKLSGLFDTTTLDPLAREVVVMTVALRNRCDVCVAMHTARLVALGADAATIAALRGGISLGGDTPRYGESRDIAPLADPRLDAVRVFALRVLDTAGDVGEPGLREFLGHGYTARNALEVVLGIGAYTMSTLANRLTGAVVDESLREFA
jgi:AhpD family alkylhydroperoxidase